jgi:hypothetical protein
MKKRQIALWTFLFLLFCSFNISEAGGVDKSQVQGAMSAFIEEKTAQGGGAYDIKGVSAEFDYIHSGVDKKWSGLYVSCADFKAGTDVYDIDYYVSKENGELKVVKEVLHKKNGKKVNEVLWKAE